MKVLLTSSVQSLLAKNAGILDTLKDIRDQWLIGKEISETAQDLDKRRPTWKQKYDTMRTDPSKTSDPSYNHPDYKYNPELEKLDYLRSRKNRGLFSYNPFKPQTQGEWRITSKGQSNPSVMNTISNFMKSYEAENLGTVELDKVNATLRKYQQDGLIEWANNQAKQANKENNVTKPKQSDISNSRSAKSVVCNTI